MEGVGDWKLNDTQQIPGILIITFVVGTSVVVAVNYKVKQIGVQCIKT